MKLKKRYKIELAETLQSHWYSVHKISDVKIGAKYKKIFRLFPILDNYIGGLSVIFFSRRLESASGSYGIGSYIKRSRSTWNKCAFWYRTSLRRRTTFERRPHPRRMESFK